MIPWTVTHLGYPLSTGYPRQEYWSGLPIPSPGDLSDPGTEPGSPALPADSLPIELPEEAHYFTDNQCLFVRTPLTYCFQDCKFTCICLHSFHFLLYYTRFKARPKMVSQGLFRHPSKECQVILNKSLGSSRILHIFKCKFPTTFWGLVLPMSASVTVFTFKGNESY